MLFLSLSLSLSADPRSLREQETEETEEAESILHPSYSRRERESRDAVNELLRLLRSCTSSPLSFGCMFECVSRIPSLPSFLLPAARPQ